MRMQRRGAALAAALGISALVAPAAIAASANVAALQVALRAGGYYQGDVDGIDGAGTRDAVRRFQARKGLAADGVAGPATRRALGRRGRPGLGSRAITDGARGWDVAALQFQLARHGFPGGPFDGGFGARTDASLRRFQAWAGLGADGVAGPGTLAALRQPPARSILRFAAPVPGGIGDRYGPRGNRFHSGVDFPVPRGTRVNAAGRGCVTFAGYDSGGYGNLVIITHRLGVVTMYAHLSSFSVRRGQCVTGHDRIGRVGSTGFSTGPHLHFEIRIGGVDGEWVDPLEWLYANTN
jgi:murein DD-endopeptidase MepM/ murein hydrolase activator NlpD